MSSATSIATDHFQSTYHAMQFQRQKRNAFLALVKRTNRELQIGRPETHYPCVPETDKDGRYWIKHIDDVAPRIDIWS